MKSFKRFLVILLVISLALPVTVIASAHSGRTDANGGHYDRDTGTYHYHHGYPAHKHTNGECPYGFDDNTRHNYTYTENGDEEEVNPALTHILYIILIIAIIVISILIVRSKNQTIKQNKEYFDNTISKLNKDFKVEITNLHNSLVATYGENYLNHISGAPADAYLDDNFLPHLLARDSSYLESFYEQKAKQLDLPISATKLNFEEQYVSDIYTYFCSNVPARKGSSIKYHNASCRYATSDMFLLNAYNINRSKKYSPCSFCIKEDVPDTSWVQRYKNNYLFFKKYVDIPITKNHKK